MFRKSKLQHMLAGPLGYLLGLVLLVTFFITIFGYISNNKSTPVLGDIRARGTILIGVMADMPPYGTMDDNGKAAGFEVELANLLGEKVLGGPGVQLYPVNAKTAIAYLDNADCDALVAMVPVNEDTEEDYALTSAYVQEDVQLLSKSDTVPSLQTPDTKIGVIKDSSAKTVLTTYLKSNHYTATVVDVASYPDAILAIESGSITSLCAARSVLDRYANSSIRVSPVTVGHFSYAVAIRKSEKDLYEAFENALKALGKEGRLNELYAKYHLSPPTN